MVGFDVCFLMKKDQGKSIPTVDARDYKTCYTHAFTCPGKSTRKEKCSEQIVIKCKNSVERLGYNRVSMKLDRPRTSNASPAAASPEVGELRNGLD